jgi:thioredoxin-related protein
VNPDRARLPAAADLPAQVRAALARGQPLVLMVTLAGCGFCDIVRRHYLAPLNAAGALVAAQIDLRGPRQLRAPDGRPMRESELVQQWGVARVPTLLFLGARGEELAPRLVGFSEHFYGGYLDAALAAARQRLAGSRD